MNEETLKPAPNALMRAVGRNVSRLRGARGLSQAELARRSGVSKATLNQLEVARGNPTIETLFALARALGVPLGVLLETDGTAPALISRAEGRVRIEGAAVDMSLANTFRSGGCLHETYYVTVRAGRQEASAHASGVQERLLVTAGRLLAGPLDAPAELGPGDFIGFDADRPHVYEAIEPPVTASLLITYPLASSIASDAEA